MAPSQSTPKGSRLGNSAHGKAKETAGSSHDEYEAPGLQDSDDLDVAKMAQRMKESSKKRRDARRGGIEQDHLDAVKKLEMEIRNTFKASAERIKKAHKHRLERLSALLKKKASIEDSMAACATRLEKALMEAIYEFQVGLQGRLDDIRSLALE